MRDELGAVAERCRSMHRHARVNADNTFGKRNRTGSWVRQVAQAMGEQLKEDQQRLETREHQRKWKMRRGYAGLIVHEMDRRRD